MDANVAPNARQAERNPVWWFSEVVRLGPRLPAGVNGQFICQGTLAGVYSGDP